MELPDTDYKNETQVKLPALTNMNVTRNVLGTTTFSNEHLAK